MRTSSLLIALTLVFAACESADPLTKARPALPPTGGPQLAYAGRLTDGNFAAESIPGPASQGLIGDFFMRNDKVRVVVQAPGRAIGPCPFGGNVIDFDFVDQPKGDQLGEVSAMLQLGRTFNPLEAVIVRDGSDGGPAVLRFRGRDAWDDFINLPGIGSFTSAIDAGKLPDVELGWQIEVVYILQPGATDVRAVYTFYNSTSHDERTTWGTISDTGAHIEIFHAASGYGEIGLDAVISGAPIPLVTYAALQGDGLAYGIVPIFADASIEGAALPVAGVNVDVYQLGSLFDAFGDAGQSLVVPAGGTATRELSILVGHDVGDVTAQAHALRGEATVAVAGKVTGSDVAGARVAVSAVGGDPVYAITTAFTADAQGSFAGALPAGTYALQAEGVGLARSPSVTVTLPASEVTLPLPDVATILYGVHDRDGVAIPAKLVAIGARPNEPSARFRDVTKDVLPHGIVDWAHTLSGISNPRFDPLSGADRPLRLVPGQYRIVVSHGPEWTWDDRIVEVPPQGLIVDAVLDHVVPTPGYAASDFHQHSHKSPDSPVPPEARVLSYVVEGIDFASTSEHDFVWDLQPTIDAVGAHGLFDTAIGIETTTWDYGHYIGFPLVVDPDSPNHGALDWANGENINGGGLNLPPPIILDRLHQAGAKVVQITHPRAPADAVTNFQQTFDRAGLIFDFDARTFYGDASIMPIEATVLGLPAGAQMFSTGFDTLEIYNGFNPTLVEGEVLDRKAELVMRDWMNFLSFGFTPTPVGVSDTHTWIADPAGMPRTLVAVSDDSPTAVAAGLRDEIADTLTGNGVPRDVIVTNGPFIRFTVDGVGIGRVVEHGPGPVAIHVAVRSPMWAPVDTIELFANNTFDIPSADPAPLLPILCFSDRPQPSIRCRTALGGARPMTEYVFESTPGVPASSWRDIGVDVTDVTVDQLISRVRAGAVGKDFWLVARASGTQAMYPSLPNNVVKADIPTLVSGTPITDEGTPAMAFTNAIFVDTDGGGWRAPFQP